MAVTIHSYNSSLHSSFSDASDTDYDRLIEETRKKMESSDPTAQGHLIKILTCHI